MRIYIVRHGETIENVKKITMGQTHGTLSARGKKQAKQIAKFLKDYSFNIIYSSDLRRCVDTAKEIKKFHPKTRIVYSKELRETHFGELQGKRWDIVSMADMPGSFMARKPKGGESLKNVKRRLTKFLNHIKRKRIDNILIVAHSGVIKMLLAILQGIHPKQIFETLELSNTGLCIVEINEQNKTKIYCLTNVLRGDIIKNNCTL